MVRLKDRKSRVVKFKVVSEQREWPVCALSHLSEVTIMVFAQQVNS